MSLFQPRDRPQVGTALVFAFIFHGRLLPFAVAAEKQKRAAVLFNSVTSTIGHHGAETILNIPLVSVCARWLNAVDDQSYVAPGACFLRC